MKVYTIQTIGFYEELLQNGVAYCNRESETCKESKVQYDWMAEQMRKLDPDEISFIEKMIKPME